MFNGMCSTQEVLEEFGLFALEVIWTKNIIA